MRVGETGRMGEGELAILKWLCDQGRRRSNSHRTSCSDLSADRGRKGKGLG